MLEVFYILFVVEFLTVFDQLISDSLTDQPEKYFDWSQA